MTTHDTDTTQRSKIERLVAMDSPTYHRNGDVQAVLDFLGDALIDHEETTVPHWRTGEPIPTHHFVFDGLQVRNTEVHGAGFRAGFVVHIESVTS